MHVSVDYSCMCWLFNGVLIEKLKLHRYNWKTVMAELISYNWKTVPHHRLMMSGRSIATKFMLIDVESNFKVYTPNLSHLTKGFDISTSKILFENNNSFTLIFLFQHISIFFSFYLSLIISFIFICQLRWFL